MNLQPYRNLFGVIVADSDLERGDQLTKSLSDVGYSCKYRSSLPTLLAEAVDHPPHVIVLFYRDFFSSDESYRELVEKLHMHLPEVHLIFLAESQDMAKACELFELGIYDCLAWPLESPQLILRAVDRAAETDYHIYLHEQLKDEHAAGSASHFSFSLFSIWLKGIEAASSRDEIIHLWMQEAVRVLKSDKAIFLRYLETKKTLVTEKSIGFSVIDLQGLGLDLEDQEPGFRPEMLREPHKIRALHDFVAAGLSRGNRAVFYPLIHRDQTLGVFVIPVKIEPSSIPPNAHEYLTTCLDMVCRQFDLLVMKWRLMKFSVFDNESETFHSDYIRKKVSEEVSRARRIQRPVSLLSLSIDDYESMALAQPKESLEKAIKAFAGILLKNSRANDLVGRAERGQFIICLPHTDARGGVVKAERLRRLMETADFSSFLGAHAGLTISAGVSEYPSICHDADGLVHSSESAMLEVKKTGANKICLAAAPSYFVPDFVVKNAKDV